MRRALLLGLLASSISCSRAPADRTASPTSAASAAQEDGLPSAVNTEPLASEAPEIVLEGDRVRVDGEPAGDVLAILDAGRPQKIDGELELLKKKREAWKSAHPGEAFPGTVLLRMPRDTRAIVVKSVYQTAAFAGYPNVAFAVGTGTPRRMARILAAAQLPGPPPTDPGWTPPPVEKVLVLRLVPDEPVALIWRQGVVEVSRTEISWGEAFERTGEEVRAPGLAAKVSAEWAMQRQHFDPQDRKLDQAIVQAADTIELRTIVAALDAVYGTKRLLVGASVPAFNGTLSVAAAASPSPSTLAPAGPTRTRITLGATTVTGRLPPEVVQRIVRANFGRFRACYEAGLARAPGLQGRVAVRFVIGKDGAVKSAADAGSGLTEPAVKKCILTAFSALGFPAPEGGEVTVVYPMELSQF